MKPLSLVLASTLLAGGAVGLWVIGKPGQKLAATESQTPATAPASELSSTQPRAISFNHDVQPILSTSCYACHGPDATTREADLRLDRREFALTPAETGRPAILENNLEASPILERLLSEDPAKAMPPPEAHRQLQPEEREILVRWVREGAVYEEHWSFLPPVRAEPPELESDSWSRSAIDRFVLERLRERGLEPNGPEEPRSLIRRVSLDLTGLLPEPADADAFAADPSDAAYEAYVEKLLASPQYGEHRGRYWLDYARYADTHGLHFDNLRAIWPYRDYVVRAFNENKPFDRFVREQVAGDLIPSASLDSWIATGYIRSNVSTNEGGAITEEVAINNVRDRTESLGSTMLGLTVGCASCHDHKFDPTTTKDYYRLSAFFTNLTEKGWDENIAEPPPILRLPSEETRPEAEELFQKIVEVRAQLDERRRQAPQIFTAALAEGRAPQPVSDEGLELRLRLDEGVGDRVRNSAPANAGEEFVAHTNPLIWGEQSWLWPGMRMDMNTRLPLGDHGDFEGDEAFSAGGWFMLRQKPANLRTRNGSLLARMGGMDHDAHRGWDIWVNGNQLGFHLIHRWPEQAIRVWTKEEFPDQEWMHVFLTYDGSAKAENVRIYINGQQVETEIKNDTLEPGLTTRTSAQAHLGRRDDESPKRETRFQDIRLYRRALTSDEVARLPFEDYAAEIVAREPEPARWTTDERFVVLERHLLGSDPQTVGLREELSRLEAAYGELTKEGTPTLIALEKSSPAYAHILARGVYNALTERVEPGTPEFLPAMPEGARADRLALADWIISEENPLLARVTVNRMWQEIFGTGLVRTPDDFGIVGERPSHPELLDWLAVEFRESGWDVKNLYRHLVLSSTYRQSSRVTAEALERDPFNHYLSRAPRFRMDAEMIRDAALQSAGLLVQKIGGPPVKPYQPPGIWAAVSMPESNTKSYEQDSGEGLYRRSVYTFWKRFAPPASLETFDAPAREVVCSERPRTNTPLQALVTMNDPQFVEASRILAERAVQAGGKPEEKLDFLSRLTLARPLEQREKAALLAARASFFSHFKDSRADAEALLTVGEKEPDRSLDPAEVAAWTLVANQFYNLDEFLNK